MHARGNLICKNLNYKIQHQLFKHLFVFYSMIKKRKKGKNFKINNSWKEFVYSIILRYGVLLITAIPNFWIFYLIFTPLTIYPVYFVLSLIFQASLSGDLIVINGASIKVIDACIAGSAYYLLLIFNLSVPNVKFVKRLKMIAFAFSSFLLVNVLRIITLSIIVLTKPNIFDISHKLTWYIGSIVIVVLIWFIEVRKFEIMDIPFYTDIKAISKHTKKFHKS